MSKANDIATFGHVVPQNNLIINGDMNVAQRGTSIVSPGNGAYTLDRWMWVKVGTGVVTISQVGSDAADRAYNRLDVDVTTADASLAATDIYGIRQYIEGTTIADSRWGTSGARDVSLSFKTAHTITGTYCVAIRNSAKDRSYVMEYTQSVANTWEEHTFTIPGDTAGTWLKTTGIGLEVIFIFAASTDGSPATDWLTSTTNTWTATNDLHTANQANGMSDAANFIRFTNIQLEYGSVATGFKSRPFGEELVLCKRYYEKSYEYDVAVGTAADYKTQNGNRVDGLTSAAHVCEVAIVFEVEKRNTPTVVSYSPGTGNSGNLYDAEPTAADMTATIIQENTKGVRIRGTQGSSKTGINALAHWTAVAEL